LNSTPPVDDVATRSLRALAIAGCVARFVLAAITFGTNDMEAWTTFGERACALDLCVLYDKVLGMFGQFNHPPLMGKLAAGIWWLAERAGVPYHLAFKSVAATADCGTALLLRSHALRSRGARAGEALFAAYAWSAISLLIAGVHGNTDAIGVFFLVAAVLMFDRDRHLLSGACFAGALNVKLIPVIAVIPVAMQLRSLRGAWRWALGLLCGAISLLLVVHCPAVFLQKVVAYIPRRENWGFPYLFDHHPPVVELLARAARAAPLVLALLAGLYVRFARGSALQAATLAVAGFILTAAGFGVQYLLYLAPLVFLVDRRLGVVYGLLAGVFVYRVYRPFMNLALPVRIHMFGHFSAKQARLGVAVFVTVWLVLVYVLTIVWRRRRLDRAGTATQGLAAARVAQPPLSQ
jgi:hypothetical protein